MKTILTIALMTVTSFSFASELSSFSGSYDLASGSKSCYEKISIDADANTVSFLGNYSDEVFNQDQSAINAGEQTFSNSGARGTTDLSFDEQESVLKYVEKGTFSVTEDGLALIPYTRILNVKQNADGTLNVKLTSVKGILFGSRVMMNCTYSK